MGEKRFFIEDEVENMGRQTSPHMFLYHINLGFPIVNNDSLLLSPTKSAAPRDVEAESGKENYNRFQPPTAGYSEKCYFHEMQVDSDGCVTAAIVNPELNGGAGLGVYVTYKKEQFPYFIEWKMMGQGEYVVGLEPGNALVMGRDKERETGRLQFIEPGEIRKYETEIGVAAGVDEIAALTRKTSL